VRRLINVGRQQSKTKTAHRPRHGGPARLD